MTKTWEEYKAHARARAEAEKAMARAQASAARGAQLREIDRLIAERGCRVEPFGSSGAQRIVGKDVDLLIAAGHWSALALVDFQ